jgi:hypothetical protein
MMSAQPVVPEQQAGRQSDEAATEDLTGSSKSTPLESVYPKANRDLRELIARDHLLVSPT